MSDNDVGALIVIALAPLFCASTNLTPEPVVALPLSQNLPDPTNWLFPVVESIPTYKSFLSTVNPGSPACRPGKLARLPLLNCNTGAAIYSP